MSLVHDHLILEAKGQIYSEIFGMHASYWRRVP
jgi:hypothetical protein